MNTSPEFEAAELAAAVCRVLAQRNWADVYSQDLFDELRRHPDAYGFTPDLQQLSVYQIFDRLNRACRLGLLARRRQPGGPVWWSHPRVEVCDIVDETIPAIVTADTLADQIEQEPQMAWNTHTLTDSNSENRVVFTDMENGQFRLDWKWDGHPLGYCFVDVADIEALAAWLREALTTDDWDTPVRVTHLTRQEVNDAVTYSEIARRLEPARIPNDEFEKYRGDCKTVVETRRVCEKGTLGCVVHHEEGLRCAERS